MILARYTIPIWLCFQPLAQPALSTLFISLAAWNLPLWLVATHICPIPNQQPQPYSARHCHALLVVSSWKCLHYATIKRRYCTIKSKICSSISPASSPPHLSSHIKVFFSPSLSPFPLSPLFLIFPPSNFLCEHSRREPKMASG